MKIKEVRHLLTYECQLRCRHCYLSAGEHKISSVEFTKEDADRFYGYFKPSIVSATGGEPLLKYNLVRILVEILNKYNGAVEIVTNGFLLTEDIVNELNSLNRKTFYQISLDGEEKYHDWLRNYKGAFKKALTAIEIASSSGRLTKVRMTVTSENINMIPEIIRILDSFERENIKLVMRPVVRAGRAEKNNLGFDGSYKTLDEFASFAKFINIETTDNLGKCGCGIDTIAIDPKGDIYPCVYTVFDSSFKMGNMFNDFEELKEHEAFKRFRGNCYARYLKQTS